MPTNDKPDWSPCGPERRLAAIFAADLAGCSRLKESDEEGARERLETLLWDVIWPNRLSAIGSTLLHGLNLALCGLPYE